MTDVLVIYGGNSRSSRKEDRDYPVLEELLEHRRLRMERVPNVGEGINLYIDRYHVYFDVRKVYTTLDVTADEHYEKYRIWADNAEIVEEFKKKGQ